jgi:hypothetical protein
MIGNLATGVISGTPTAVPKATGGTITSDATHFYHTFTGNGTFTPLVSLTADILVIAGGGGGGINQYGNTVGGGGGAGGLLGFTSQSLTAIGYTCTIGGGGTANTTGSASTNGIDSQFGSLTLVKGGGRGAGWAGSFFGSGSQGSGGGGAGFDGSFPNGGTATSSQGFNGGSSTQNGPLYPAGGGGGSAQVGQTAPSNSQSGNGGNGVTTYSTWGTVTSTGENVSGTRYYAGGGAAGQYSGVTRGTAGLGGGGAGAIGGTSNATAGTVNTGGGGGSGINNSPGAAAAGGSGLVIVRYLK